MIRKTLFLGLGWLLALSVTVGCAGRGPFMPGGPGPSARNDFKKGKPQPFNSQTASFPTGQNAFQPTQQQQAGMMGGPGGPMAGQMSANGQMTSPGGAMMMNPNMPMQGGPPPDLGMQAVQYQPDPRRPIASNVPQQLPPGMPANAFGAPNPMPQQFNPNAVPGGMVPASLSTHVPY